MIEQAVRDWGYLAVFVGTLFEGETVLVLAGFAAHRGYLALPGVMAAAFAGSLCAGQLLFWVGLRKGPPLLSRHPRLGPRLERAGSLIDRWGDLLTLGFRFTYLLRPLVPLALGLSRRVPPARFALLNLAGAAAWAGVVSVAGYLFGAALQGLVGDLERMEGWVAAGVAAAGLAVWAILHLRHFRPRP